MRLVRLASLVALVALAGLAGRSEAAVQAPQSLHGFLLRADEPATTTFHRTPSFAWSPVLGAVRYEFQLATSSTFRDNGILYDNASLVTPVEAPPLTLPWITGSPHALYARVRALFAAGATPWSAPFGFDVTPPAPPAPLSAYPGLLRWTPVEGADAYEIWLVDAGKMETVRTNVLDERDFYTFHQSQQWIGTVRWRIRALRGDVYTYRVNGMPVAQYGAWSPVYTSTNPAAANGPISLVGTVSDVFSDGSPTAAAHALMPAFVWTGNETQAGTPAALFRVYVFTDSQCLNRVFTSAVVGTPAYAPRLSGPLALPADAAGLTAAGASYLGDGSEQGDVTYDGEAVQPNEQLPAAAPTVAPAGDVPAASGTIPPLSSTGSSSAGSSSSSSSSGSSGSSASGVSVNGKLGPPVDLWDVSWPQSGYYWTVVPVAAVTSSGGAVRYQDLELPQDVCWAGRVQRFGIASQPSLTTARQPFATGLSATGRLVSAAGTPAFYGQPLVAWTPALDANVYEVQWSRTRYPFVPESDPRTNARGYLTFSTSAVLPLGPGTWWYRVRGYDYNLPTGVQQMSWSQPERLVVTRPRFRVAKVAPGARFAVVGGSK